MSENTTQAIETTAVEEYFPSEDLGSLPRQGLLHEETAELVEELFAFHAWTPEMIEGGKRVRETLADAYKAIIKHVPPSPSRTRALNCLTDARMLANTAITFKGVV